MIPWNGTTDLPLTSPICAWFKKKCIDQLPASEKISLKDCWLRILSYLANFFLSRIFSYFLSFSVRWSQIIVFFHVKTPQFRLLIAAGKTRQTTEHSSFFSSFLCKKKIPSDLALDRERSLTLAYFSYSILCRRFAPSCAAARASHSDLYLITLEKINLIQIWYLEFRIQ